MLPSRRTFLKQLGLGSGALVFAGPGFSSAWAAEADVFPRSTPAVEGVESAGIMAFLEAVAAAKIELHSLMIARHGRVIAEGWYAPYEAELRHTMYSMSKSFTSTAIGFAVAEKKLTVEDKVISFFPKELPEKVSENLAALRVRDLLTMSVGSEKEPTHAMVQEEDWVRAFLAHTISHAPGSVFMYNSAATYMCSAIVSRLTGQTVLSYLTPRLFAPLEIEKPTWETCPRGINTGGWGLSIQTEGLAKFGQTLLQKGKWQGREVIPAAWVAEATAFHIQQPKPAKPARPHAQNDWLQGYGYQFWRCQHGGFRGDGAFGQFTIVLPEQDAVIAMTSESSNMQGELDLVWEHLLPAMKAGALPLPQGAVASPVGARLSGKSFRLEENSLGLQSASFDFTKNKVCRFSGQTATGDFPILCGLGKWNRGQTAFPGTPPRLISGGAPPAGTKFAVAASGAWRDDATFEMTWRYIETPHHDTVTCRFDGDTVEIQFLSSIARGKDARPVLRGKVVA